MLGIGFGHLDGKCGIRRGAGTSGYDCHILVSYLQQCGVLQLGSKSCFGKYKSQDLASGCNWGGLMREGLLDWECLFCG